MSHENTRRGVLRSLGVGGLGAATLGSTSSAVAATATATATGPPFADGVNLQPSYYCEGRQDLGWDLLDEFDGVGAVRIEIEPDDAASLYQAKRWIDEADARGYDVIATYHQASAIGSPDPATLQAAADWWVSNYGYLSRDASFTVNLMNEWGDHSVGVDEYARAYDDALARVRESGYDGPVVCDVPGWAQNVSVAARAAPKLDDDLLFSVHCYDSAYNGYYDEPLRPEHLAELDDTDYPCIVGEFGSKHSGDADWAALVDQAKSLGWPVFAWAWNGDGRGMNMAAPFWGDRCADSYSRSPYVDTVAPKLTGADDPVDSPTGVRASDVGTTHVTVVWDRVDGADGYRVYREHLATGDGASVVVTDRNYASVTDLEPNADYRLWVGARDGADVAAWSRPIEVATDRRSLPAPSNVRVSDVGTAHLTVVWDRVDGADGYRVYHENRTTRDGFADRVAGQNYASITRLDPATTYRLWVGTERDGEVTDWSRSLDATTDGTP